MADRYWVGDGGNWSAGPNHWASSSGGSPGSSVPSTGDQVFIDSNSFSTDGETITQDQSVEVLNISFVPERAFIFTTSGYSITVTSTGVYPRNGLVWEYADGSTFNASSSVINLNSGTGFILFARTTSQNMTFSGELATMNLSDGSEFQLNASWAFGGGVISGRLGELNVPSGSINLSYLKKTLEHTLVVDTLNISPGATVTFPGSSDDTVLGTMLVIDLNANGTSGSGIVINNDGAGRGKLSVSRTSLSFITVSDNAASGIAAPFDASDNGTDAGGNTGWCFSSCTVAFTPSFQIL